MKIICIDDEQLALEYLVSQLKKIENIEVVGTFFDPMKALEKIRTQHIDIVMLDVQMPEVNGLELAETIMAENPNIYIVFITAYSQFAIDAFQLNAIDYIVKPITVTRLHKTIERIQKQTGALKEKPKQQKALNIQTSNDILFSFEKDKYREATWRTSKTKELFVYLLQHRGELIAKSTILELLWDELDEERGYALLYTTVYNVRKALRPFKNNIILHNVGKNYFLELANVVLESAEWENRLQEINVVNDSTIQQYEEIVGGIEPGYLETLDYQWLREERDRRKGLWITAANAIATYYGEKGLFEQAIRWRYAVCDKDPKDEEAYAAFLKLYRKLENHNVIHKEFKEFKRMLERLQVSDDE